MPIGEDYSPKYIDSLEDLPIDGPDDYRPGEKRKALYHAESEIEIDVNDGSQISSSDLKDIHKTAILNLATHFLTRSAEDPSDVTLGDMASEGGELVEYSSQYLETYNRLVDKILESGIGNSSGNNYSVVVNNDNVGDNSTTHTS